MAWNPSPDDELRHENDGQAGVTESSYDASTPLSTPSADDDGLLEPIAIIGMSCRLPGSAHDIPGFWNMLQHGRSAWTPGPMKKRFNMEAFQDPSGTIADSVSLQKEYHMQGERSVLTIPENRPTSVEHTFFKKIYVNSTQRFSGSTLSRQL